MSECPQVGTGGYHSRDFYEADGLPCKWCGEVSKEIQAARVREAYYNQLVLSLAANSMCRRYIDGNRRKYIRLERYREFSMIAHNDLLYWSYFEGSF